MQKVLLVLALIAGITVTNVQAACKTSCRTTGCSVACGTKCTTTGGSTCTTAGSSTCTTGNTCGSTCNTTCKTTVAPAKGKTYTSVWQTIQSRRNRR